MKMCSHWTNGHLLFPKTSGVRVQVCCVPWVRFACSSMFFQPFLVHGHLLKTPHHNVADALINFVNNVVGNGVGIGLRTFLLYQLYKMSASKLWQSLLRAPLDQYSQPVVCGPLRGEHDAVTGGPRRLEEFKSWYLKGVGGEKIENHCFRLISRGPVWLVDCTPLVWLYNILR